MKIAVIGSRSFNDYEKLDIELSQIIDVIKQSGDDVILVSGGARGADSLAEQYANNNGIEILVFKADWKKYGRSAGFIRNKDIINNSDLVIAFWDGVSNGTKHSINLAKKQNKKIIIRNIE